MMNRIVQGIPISVVAVSFGGCSAPTGSVQASSPKAAGSDPRVISGESGPKDLLSVSSLFLAVPEYSERADVGVEIRKSFYRTLVNTFSIESGVQVSSLSGSSSNSALMNGASREEMMAQARRQGANAVLYTVVNEYVSRNGSGIGASQGAKISVSQEAVRVSDGKRVWDASYFFADQALTDNVLKLKERLNDGNALEWKDESKVVQMALSSLAKDLSERRAKQFMR